jgi:hypothetical protein
VAFLLLSFLVEAAAPQDGASDRVYRLNRTACMANGRLIRRFRPVQPAAPFSSPAKRPLNEILTNSQPSRIGA